MSYDGGHTCIRFLINYKNINMVEDLQGTLQLNFFSNGTKVNRQSSWSGVILNRK